MKSFSLFYKEVEGNEGNKCHYTTRLDTYGCGCQHDCKYCYAKSLLDFRGLWNNEKPVVGNMKQIRNAIIKAKKSGVKVLRLGGMTDCFQPLELKYRTTYQTIRLLNKYKIEYLIVTKSHLVANEEYMKIYDKDLAHFQITTTCLDDDLYKKLDYEKASVPSWLKPYKVLSNGEKMRVNLARALLEKDVICFDEFTSVVDRQVAKTACIAINKAIKNTNKKFIAVSCHKDIIEWLQPDWLFDTDTMQQVFQSAHDLRKNFTSKNVGETNGKNLASITI